MRLIMLSLLLFITACAEKSTMKNGKPAWYWNPSKGEHIGGVGEAGFHINGKSAQRQLAISRAIDEIARQKGVHIQNITEVAQQSNINSENVNLSSYSVHTVEGVTINIRLMEIWQDQSGAIVAWCIEN